MSSEPPRSATRFDRARALDNLDGDEALLGEMARAFVADYAQRLEVLQLAVAEADRDRLYSCTHSLKGATLSFCADYAVALAREIEAACRGGDLHEAIRGAKALQEEVEALVAHLRASGLA